MLNFLKTPSPYEMNLRAREAAARDLVRFRLSLEEHQAHVAMLEARIARIDREMAEHHPRNATKDQS